MTGDAILWTLRRQCGAIWFGAVGLFLLSLWLIFPPPSLQDFNEVEGRLSSYGIEMASHQPNRPYLIFSISGHDGRFWTLAVSRNNAETVFTRRGTLLKFHRRSDPKEARLVNGAVKSYGLTVDGVTIKSVEDALKEDSEALVLLSVVAIIFLLVGAHLWWRNSG